MSDAGFGLMNAFAGDDWHDEREAKLRARIVELESENAVLRQRAEIAEEALSLTRHCPAWDTVDGIRCLWPPDPDYRVCDKCRAAYVYALAEAGGQG